MDKKPSSVELSIDEPSSDRRVELEQAKFVFFPPLSKVNCHGTVEEQEKSYWILFKYVCIIPFVLVAMLIMMIFTDDTNYFAPIWFTSFCLVLAYIFFLYLYLKENMDKRIRQMREKRVSVLKEEGIDDPDKGNCCFLDFMPNMERVSPFITLAGELLDEYSDWGLIIAWLKLAETKIYGYVGLGIILNHCILSAIYYMHRKMELSVGAKNKQIAIGSGVMQFCGFARAFETLRSINLGVAEWDSKTLYKFEVYLEAYPMMMLQIAMFIELGDINKVQGNRRSLFTEGEDWVYATLGLAFALSACTVISMGMTYDYTGLVKRSGLQLSAIRFLIGLWRLVEALVGSIAIILFARHSIGFIYIPISLGVKLVLNCIAKFHDTCCNQNNQAKDNQSSDSEDSQNSDSKDNQNSDSEDNQNNGAKDNTKDECCIFGCEAKNRGFYRCYLSLVTNLFGVDMYAVGAMVMNFKSDAELLEMYDNPPPLWSSPVCCIIPVEMILLLWFINGVDEIESDYKTMLFAGWVFYALGLIILAFRYNWEDYFMIYEDNVIAMLYNDRYDVIFAEFINRNSKVVNRDKWKTSLAKWKERFKIVEKSEDYERKKNDKDIIKMKQFADWISCSKAVLKNLMTEAAQFNAHIKLLDFAQHRWNVEAILQFYMKNYNASAFDLVSCGKEYKLKKLYTKFKRKQASVPDLSADELRQVLYELDSKVGEKLYSHSVNGEQFIALTEESAREFGINMNIKDLKSLKRKANKAKKPTVWEKFKNLLTTDNKTKGKELEKTLELIEAYDLFEGHYPQNKLEHWGIDSILTVEEFKKIKKDNKEEMEVVDSKDNKCSDSKKSSCCCSFSHDFSHDSKDNKRSHANIELTRPGTTTLDVQSSTPNSDSQRPDVPSSGVQRSDSQISDSERLRKDSQSSDLTVRSDTVNINPAGLFNFI